MTTRDFALEMAKCNFYTRKRREIKSHWDWRVRVEGTAQHDRKLIRTYCMFFNHLVFCLLFICTLFFFFFVSTFLLFFLLLLTRSILNRHYSLLLTHIMYLTTQLSLSWMQSLFALFTSLSHISSLSSYFHTIFCLHIHFFSTYIYMSTSFH